MDAYLTDENGVQIVDEDGTPYVIGSISSGGLSAIFDLSVAQAVHDLSVNGDYDLSV